MKKIIGLVIVLAALVLGGYYATGLITERTIKKNIAVINQSNGLLVEVKKYDRGWYTSTALLNWHLHIPPRESKNAEGQVTTIPAQDYSIDMPLTIYHGPIIFSDKGVKFGLGYAHTDLTMPEPYADKFSTVFTENSTKPVLSLSLFVNYLNTSRLHIGLPNFKLISKDSGSQFEWNGMDSHISISSNLRSIDGGLTLDGATLSKNNIKATLGKVDTDYDLHETDAGLYLGEANLSIPSFVITENNQTLLSVEEFDANSSSDVEGDLFNTHFKTSLTKILARGKTYGPATLEMSIKNLDAKVLAEINTKLNQMQQGTDNARQQALIALIPSLPKLFSKGAQFEVSKLSFVVPEGDIEGNLLISLPKGDAGNPFQLIQKVEGHGKLTVPASVLKSLMVTSLKHKLISEQPSIQQAMIQQLKQHDAGAVQKSNPPAENPAQAANGAQTTNASLPATTQGTEQKSLTVAEIEQQAIAQADQKLATMLKTGLITSQDNNYVIEVNLTQGQLSVNGKPFTTEMTQF
jgi:uncharacterized protein YdgA (DUF945 family)